MDNVKRDALIRKFKAQNLLEPQGRWAPLPVVPLEDFFDGNDDYGSIGCNLLEREHPWSRAPLSLPELQPDITLFTAWWD